MKYIIQVEKGYSSIFRRDDEGYECELVRFPIEKNRSKSPFDTNLAGRVREELESAYNEGRDSAFKELRELIGCPSTDHKHRILSED